MGPAAAAAAAALPYISFDLRLPRFGLHWSLDGRRAGAGGEPLDYRDPLRDTLKLLYQTAPNQTKRRSLPSEGHCQSIEDPYS